ncbi:hypothetical protein [Mesorhizobium marinum]|uniref:hypothetical protein n=1 Tax=Mesorhizobium marinum TaxID=3228790 RepID=UPI00346708E0
MSKLADILSGGKSAARRQELHAMLDALLDAADADGGRADAAAFWSFVASVAEGRSIADEIEEAAVSAVAGQGALAEPAALFRDIQFAIVFHLLGRLRAVGDAILPESYRPAAFRAVMLNLINPEGGIHPDVLGVGSTRAGDGALHRAARRQLVMAVYFRAEKDGVSLAEARRRVLPELAHDLSFNRTWQGWQREVASAKGVSIDRLGDDAKAAVHAADASTYDLDSETVENLWRWAWRPR